jgi:hypothetical protein
MVPGSTETSLSVGLSAAAVAWYVFVLIVPVAIVAVLHI